MAWIYWIDYIGTFIFAISGMIAALNKKFDLFGVFVIGIVTATGGGTLRDLLIGNTPVSWIRDNTYLNIILTALVVTFLFRHQIVKLKISFFLFDTLGIGLFTILGLEKTLDIGLSYPIAVLMGIISAVFGGVVRDVLLNDEPLIFKKEIYASACLVGALIYLVLKNQLPINYSMLISIASVIIIRIVAIKYRWHLNF